MVNCKYMYDTSFYIGDPKRVNLTWKNRCQRNGLRVKDNSCKFFCRIRSLEQGAVN